MVRRPTRSRSRSRAVAVAAALTTLLLAAACGSDNTSSDGASSGGAASATTAASASSAPAPGKAATEADSPFCRQIADASAKFGVASTSANGMADALNQLPEAAALLAQAQADAPAEVKGDLQVLADTLGEIAPSLSALGGSQTDPTALQTVLGAFAKPEVATAIANLDAYAKEHCGVSFTGS